ncbi:35358_t:CDS:2 [Gigaspora margarita]|uniref:35358_t:CDS:1 n=1 Tax=Gigaspora margarita TaxID=4874 RepID=A0ABN7URN1_GIGMA|nr:35358_t:CDS:2 [Gigaspora margarita]
MRVEEDNGSNDFINFRLRIGNGTEPAINEDMIRIPDQIVIYWQDNNESLQTLINSIYPNIHKNAYNSIYITNCAILTTRNDYVEHINKEIIKQFSGDSITYYSYDSGQIIPHVGLYLPEHVFTYGQLYVAFSRVKSAKNLKVLVKNGDVLGKQGTYTPQELPNKIKNTEDSIIEMMISDYAGHNYNFNVKVVFPFMHSRFAQLKNLIQPKESLIFVIGQMKIINNNLYINAKDISYITFVKPTHSKLLSIHQSITETSEETSQNFLKFPTTNNSVDKFYSNSSLSDPHPLKCTKNDKINEYTEELSDNDNTNTELDTKKSNNKTKPVRKHENLESKNNNTHGKKATRGRKKGKECVIQTTVHNTRKSCKNTVTINE